MAQGSPTVLVMLMALVNAGYVLCAMVLYSAIIIWLSLEFTAGIPAAMAFIVATLCLVTAILGIILFGGKDTRDLFTALYILFSVFVLLACIGLLPPFSAQFYSAGGARIGDTCNDCAALYDKDPPPRCVDDCNDECCFRDLSSPLVRLMMAFVIIGIFVSVCGTVSGAIHFYLIRRESKANNQ